MANRIKGITVEIGGDTTKLQTALKGVNSSIRDTQSQLRDVEKLLKLDPGNTELLAQKHRLLGEAVAGTKEKLETLKTAAEQANTALANGEITQDQYDALQREIIETENHLRDLERQAGQSAVALQKIAATGEKLKTVGDNISSAGQKLLPVTAGVTALGTAAVSTAANFESSMSQVQATMGITKDAMSTVNGEDTLSFSIPFADAKRKYIDNEKKIQIVDDVYIIRTVTDSKDSSGSAVTEVYAEAEFYNLAYSVRKEEKAFDAETADAAMAYALSGTEWNVGTVTVTTKRTWTSTEKNALSILRNVADLHGGDLVFDCPNRLMHLLTLNGKDSGALFMYGKNMKDIKRTVDTTGLVTRLYAVGADGMTFASINGGKAYVEDFTYSKEVRVYRHEDFRILRPDAFRH